MFRHLNHLYWRLPLSFIIVLAALALLMLVAYRG